MRSIYLKKSIFIFLGLIIPNFIFAFNFTTDLQLRYDISARQPLNQYLSFEAEHETEYINFFWDFSISNDLKYQPSHGENLYFGFYFFMERGGLSLNFKDIDFTVGRTSLEDEVESPYSLFVSSKLPPALLADFSFDDGIFFFKSRWTELNRSSNLGFPDRGWQYNSYGLHIGDFRIGFQDSSVYTGTSFDPEYFLNPLPGFLKQYTLISAGKPWSSGGNANSIVGFFTEYENADLYLYGQLLIDDFTNILGLFNPATVMNPNKIAWSLGGDYDMEYGKIGFYHAGATKYTFQSFGAAGTDSKYGYTFYPAVTYTANGVLMPIKLEDNYLGYYLGENNISFLINYEGEYYDAGLYAAVEFSLSGDKSPANPWHQYSWYTEDTPYGTKLLDSENIEKRLVFQVGASRPMTERGLPNLVLSLSGEIGYIWNVLNLVDVPAEKQTPHNNIQYWSPSNKNSLVLSIAVGGRYTF